MSFFANTYSFSRKNEIRNSRSPLRVLIVFVLVTLIYLPLGLIFCLLYFVYTQVRYTSNRRDTGNDVLVVATCLASQISLDSYFAYHGIKAHKIYDPWIFSVEEDDWEDISRSRVKLKSLFYAIRFLNATIFSPVLNVENFVRDLAELRDYSYIFPRLIQGVRFAMIIHSKISLETPRELYSGLRDERFAYLLNDLCNKTGVSTVCIPHGLAYSHRFPNGLFGQKYYCFTEAERQFLSSMYEGISFEVDSRWLKQRYSKNRLRDSLTFMSSSRDVEFESLTLKNIQRNVNSTILFKPHPNEQIERYDIANITLCSNLSEALMSRIIVSPPSTVLIEALYTSEENLVVCLAITTKQKSSLSTYPALNDKRIVVIENLDSLWEILS